MTELILRNKAIIADLEKIRKAVLSKIHQDSLPSTQNCEKFMSEEYLKKRMSDSEHEGFPIEYHSLPLSPNPNFEEINNFVKGDFIANLGANTDAVFLYYPKDGYVGWHNNANNSGYQFIFSWSEKGDGYFQYYDKKKEEIVKIPDVAGWQVRCYHFGKEEEDHCWHSAYTNVPRITICALFRWWDKPEMKEQILAMKDQLIEDIESEI